MSDAETTRMCSKCGKEKPVSEFSRLARGRNGLETECRTCRNRRRRRSKAIADRPNGHEAINQAVEHAPDPQPAIRLRIELERLRDAGRPWRVAWPIAVGGALRDLPPGEAASWRRVFNETRGAWQGSYCGIPWPVASRRLVVPDDDQLAA